MEDAKKLHLGELIGVDEVATLCELTICISAVGDLAGGRAEMKLQWSYFNGYVK